MAHVQFANILVFPSRIKYLGYVSENDRMRMNVGQMAACSDSVQICKYHARYDFHEKKENQKRSSLPGQCRPRTTRYSLMQYECSMNEPPYHRFDTKNGSNIPNCRFSLANILLGCFRFRTAASPSLYGYAKCDHQMQHDNSECKHEHTRAHRRMPDNNRQYLFGCHNKIAPVFTQLCIYL